MINNKNTPFTGSIFVMPAFSLQNLLAERGFRPQAHLHYTRIHVFVHEIDKDSLLAHY